MSCQKRVAEKQLTKDTADGDERRVGAEEGEFARASVEELSKRRIVRAKRRLPSSGVAPAVLAAPVAPAVVTPESKADAKPAEKPSEEEKKPSIFAGLSFADPAPAADAKSLFAGLNLAVPTSSASAPAVATAADSSKPSAGPTGGWSCPMCLTSNSETSAFCGKCWATKPAAGAPSPEKKKDSADDKKKEKPATPEKKPETVQEAKKEETKPSSTSSPSAAAVGGFSFGTVPPPGGFSFGISAPAPVSAPSEKKEGSTTAPPATGGGGFSFGTAAPTTGGGGFTFGGPSPVTASAADSAPTDGWKCPCCEFINAKDATTCKECWVPKPAKK